MMEHVNIRIHRCDEPTIRYVTGVDPVSGRDAVSIMTAEQLHRMVTELVNVPVRSVEPMRSLNEGFETGVLAHPVVAMPPSTGMGSGMAMALAHQAIQRGDNVVLVDTEMPTGTFEDRVEHAQQNLEVARTTGVPVVYTQVVDGQAVTPRMERTGDTPRVRFLGPQHWDPRMVPRHPRTDEDQPHACPFCEAAKPKPKELEW